MNQNDKFHSGITPELNEEQLDSVSGGAAIDLKEWENQGRQEAWCRNCNAKTWHTTYFRSGYNKFRICKVCGDSWGGDPMVFR